MAGSVHLPLHVRGFSVRGVKRAPGTEKSLAPHSSAPATPIAAATQLFYSNGEQAISVFVTPSPPTPAAAGGGGAPRSPAQSPHGPSLPSDAVRQNPAWHSAPLDGGRVGYTREVGAGAAVAWTAPEGSYVAISRMPLPRLLPVVAAIAADRDDAPEQRSRR